MQIQPDAPSVKCVYRETECAAHRYHRSLSDPAKQSKYFWHAVFFKLPRYSSLLIFSQIIDIFIECSGHYDWLEDKINEILKMGTFCDIPIDRVMANLLKDKTKHLYASMFALNLNQIVTNDCEKGHFLLFLQIL